MGLIMERHLDYEADPEGFYQEWQPREQELSRRIEQARDLVDKVTHSTRDLLTIAGLTASLNVEGHRSDLVILKAARAHAAYERRPAINERDIALAAELALPHRMRQGPFSQNAVNPEQVQERIEQLQGAASTTGEPQPSDERQGSPEKKKA